MQESEQNPRLSLREKQHLSAECHTVETEFPLHWHSFFEVELIMEGCGTQELNGHTYCIEAGTAYILRPTDFHTIRAERPIRLWNISFDEAIISEQRLYMLSRSTLRRFYTPEAAVMRQLCSLAELLHAESAHADGCARELCESLLCILLRGTDSAAHEVSAHLAGIRRALLYMDVHFRENPTLAQAAAQAGFHPHYFSEMFKKVTGENYTAHLNALRVSYARSLLSKGFSVTETCYQSGFGSLSNFLIVFRRTVGCTPDEYRRAAQGTPRT